MLIKDFNIQLYSVRHEIEKLGLPAVLEKLAAVGYTGVEFAGYWGYGAEDMLALLQKHGLKPAGAHIGLERLEEAFGEETAYHRALGIFCLTIPSAPFGSPEETAQTAKRLGTLVEKGRDYGFCFAFHNHWEEFEKDREGRYRLEDMMAAVPGIDIQLDLCWAAKMGCDCEGFIKKHSPRVTSLHIKQIDAAGNGCDLPDGVLDFAALIKAGLANGVHTFIHEQEEFAGEVFTSLARGFSHIGGLT
jgi:sugar phosphate isomerase/epimerase